MTAGLERPEKRAFEGNDAEQDAAGKTDERHDFDPETVECEDCQQQD
jgi:hypothetical protein